MMKIHISGKKYSWVFEFLTYNLHFIFTNSLKTRFMHFTKIRGLGWMQGREKMKREKSGILENTDKSQESSIKGILK